MRNNSEVYWQPIDIMLSNSVCKYLMCCGHIIFPPVLTVATINSAKIVRCLFEASVRGLFNSCLTSVFLKRSGVKRTVYGSFLGHIPQFYLMSSLTCSWLLNIPWCLDCKTSGHHLWYWHGMSQLNANGL